MSTHQELKVRGMAAFELREHYSLLFKKSTSICPIENPPDSIIITLAGKKWVQHTFTRPFIKESVDNMRQYKKRTGQGKVIYHQCRNDGFTRRQGEQRSCKCCFCWRELGRQMFDGSLKRKNLECKECASRRLAKLMSQFTSEKTG